MATLYITVGATPKLMINNDIHQYDNNSLAAK